MKHYTVETYTVADSVGYLMRHTASLLRDELETAFEGHGFTFVQWATMMRLRDNMRLTAGDLCRDLRHDTGAFTRVIDHLEERGLVSRERSDDDRRVVLLKLTSAGRQAVQSMLPVVVDRLNEALQDLSASELATLVRLLRRISARLNDPVPATERPARRGARP
jgi:DNA-binding MarR family transcriptional regulator